MFNEFLKLHNKLIKSRSNDFIALLELLQDVKEGKINQNVYEDSFVILKDRLKYYDSCIAGLEYGFFTYFLLQHQNQLKIHFDIEGEDEETAEELKQVISSRLGALQYLAGVEYEGVESDILLEESEEYDYEGPVKAFLTHSTLGTSMAQSMNETKMNKTYKKIRKRH